MQILEAALAFAITMLVLSLTCSSFVEIIHRIFSMREAGLKYMLGQVFDQVIVNYIDKFKKEAPNPQSPLLAKSIQELRDSFVERMSSNRAPMGVTPNATPTTTPVQPAREISLWSGRDLTSLEPSEFMERLGSIDIGEAIKHANQKVGSAVADTYDAVLKDVAQKFEGFGKEAGAYFEGRARLLSVIVAILLAFAIRVDAIELFNTYLRDPNARNKVIEQSQAVTAQYKAAADAASAMKGVGASDADIKAQVEALQKQVKDTLESTRGTVKQYSDLGLPIGWTKENATLNPWKDTCTSPDGRTTWLIDNSTQCDTAKGTKGTVGWGALKLAASLLLGGILIGLGGPFWYNAVTGLTNIRGIARDISGTGTKPAGTASGGTPQAAPQAVPDQPPPQRNPDQPQPSTPAGAFTIAHAGREAAPPPPLAPGGAQGRGNQGGSGQ